MAVAAVPVVTLAATVAVAAFAVAACWQKHDYFVLADYADMHSPVQAKLQHRSLRLHW